jgi:ferredoxin
MDNITNSKIEIDIENCTGCKACVKECVANLFYFKADLLQLVDTFEDSCIECGHCEAVCPVDVITLRYHKQEELKDNSIKERIPSFDSFLNLALTRRSIRQFKDKAISKDLIEKLLEIARYSPTGSNSENVYYTIIQNKEIVTAISNHITKKTIGFVKALETPQGRAFLKERLSEEEFNLAEENLPTTKRILKSIEQGIDFWCWNGELYPNVKYKRIPARKPARIQWL